MAFKLLFIGDVVGRPGRRVLANRLSGLCSRLDVDLVVANGEHAAGGASDQGEAAGGGPPAGSGSGLGGAPGAILEAFWSKC